MFEISDEPSKNIFETEKDKERAKELEEHKVWEDVTLNSSIATGYN